MCSVVFARETNTGHAHVFFNGEKKSTIKPLSHTLLNLKTKFLGKMKWHQHKSRSTCTCIYSDAISYAHISFLTANSWLSFTMYLDWFCILLPVGVSLDGLRCLVWKWTVSWEPINKFYFCFYFWHFFLLIWINYVHAKIFFGKMNKCASCHLTVYTILIHVCI